MAVPPRREEGRSARLAFESARLALSRMRFDGVDPCSTASREAVALCARTLNVDRVGIWIFDPSRTTLTCVLQYSHSSEEVTSGEALEAAEFPDYCAALESKSAIVANDALGDPDTRELRDYLMSLSIGSMLDVPIFRDGEVIGVVCHEHKGPPRTWQQSEVEFAASVAALISTVFEQADRLAAEEKARRQAFADTMEVQLQLLERLARSVAHDLNNLLAAVDASSLLLRDREGDDHRLGETLHGCAEMATRLTKQLATFGREPDEAHEGPVSMRETLTNLAPIVRTLLRHQVSVDFALDAAGPAFVHASRREVEQIALNLALNAGDAATEASLVQISLEKREESVVLHVEDNGVGMSQAMLERMWEPYFTTKSNGSGLGLEIVKSHVDRLQGRLDVESTPGRGTRFVVYFPHAGAIPPVYSPVANR